LIPFNLFDPFKLLVTAAFDPILFNYFKVFVFHFLENMKSPTRPKSLPKIVLTGKSLIVKHQSLTHNALRHNAAQGKNQDIEDAMQWCRDNKRGWLVQFGWWVQNGLKLPPNHPKINFLKSFLKLYIFKYFW